MADKKITDLTEVTSVSPGDYFAIVDISDTTDDAAGTNKKISRENLFQGSVSVLDYGATGDGVTDDTAAIQAALDAVDEVVLPPGTYITSSALIPNSNQKILGSGIGNTIIKRGDSTAGMQVISMVGVANITISDLEIDGNRANQTESGHGIRGEDLSGFWLRDVYIHDAYSYGLGFEAGTMSDIHLNNIKIKDTGADGIDFKNDNSLNARIFLDDISVENPGLRADLETQAGIDIRGPATLNNINVSGLDDDQHGVRFREAGVHGNGGLYSSLSNFYITGSGASSIGVYVPAERGVIISNGTVVGTNQGVYLYGAYHKISGVHADACLSTGFETAATGNYATIVGCIARSCQAGFKLVGDNPIMNACIARASVAANLETTSACAGAIITSNQFLSGGSANANNGTGITQANNVGY